MARTPKSYTRLTRNVAGIAGYSSLWLAADHLVIVRSAGYTESYTRIELRDIKAIFLLPSDRRMWRTLIVGLLTAFPLLAFINGLVSRQTPVASAILLAAGVVAIGWNHALGRGCRAHVVTAVQTAEVPLVRLPKARRVLAQLDPLIRAAQADLSGAAGSPAGSETASASPAPSA